MSSLFVSTNPSSRVRRNWEGQRGKRGGANLGAWLLLLNIAYQEGIEQSVGRKEVPNVVVVIETKPNTFMVLGPGIGGC